MGFFLDNWPVIGSHVPRDLQTVGYRHGNMTVTALTSHPTSFKPNWGATPFSAADFMQAPFVPDGFVAVGIFATDYEHLFLMWQRDNRRFHFYDLYFSGGNLEARGVDLYARSREHLDLALADWETTKDERVAHSIGRRVSEEAIAAASGREPWAASCQGPAPEKEPRG